MQYAHSHQKYSILMIFMVAISLTGCGSSICETKHSLSNGYDLTITQPDTWEATRPVDVVIRKNGVEQLSVSVDDSEGNCVTGNYVLTVCPTDSNLFAVTRKGDSVAIDTVLFVIDTSTGDSWPFRLPNETRQDAENKKSHLFSRWP